MQLTYIEYLRGAGSWYDGFLPVTRWAKSFYPDFIDVETEYHRVSQEEHTEKQRQRWRVRM